MFLKLFKSVVGSHPSPKLPRAFHLVATQSLIGLEPNVERVSRATPANPHAMVHSWVSRAPQHFFSKNTQNVFYVYKLTPVRVQVFVATPVDVYRGL